MLLFKDILHKRCAFFGQIKDMNFFHFVYMHRKRRAQTGRSIPVFSGGTCSEQMKIHPAWIKTVLCRQPLGDGMKHGRHRVEAAEIPLFSQTDDGFNKRAGNVLSPDRGLDHQITYFHDPGEPTMFLDRYMSCDLMKIILGKDGNIAAALQHFPEYVNIIQFLMNIIIAVGRVDALDHINNILVLIYCRPAGKVRILPLFLFFHDKGSCCSSIFHVQPIADRDPLPFDSKLLKKEAVDKPFSQDPFLVMEYEADDLTALFIIPLCVQHLVQSAEARVDAPAQHGLLQGRVSLYDFMPHLVRHLQKVKLARRETAVDDGVHVVHIVIF